MSAGIVTLVVIFVLLSGVGLLLGRDGNLIRHHKPAH